MLEEAIASGGTMKLPAVAPVYHLSFFHYAAAAGAIDTDGLAETGGDTRALKRLQAELRFSAGLSAEPGLALRNQLNRQLGALLDRVPEITGAADIPRERKERRRLFDAADLDLEDILEEPERPTERFSGGGRDTDDHSTEYGSHNKRRASRKKGGRIFAEERAFRKRKDQGRRCVARSSHLRTPMMGLCCKSP